MRNIGSENTPATGEQVPAAPVDDADSLASRLQAVCVRTRPELEVSRHVFRGEVSYIVHDPVTFKSHQLTAEDYQVFVALDLDRPLVDVFDGLVSSDVLQSDREEEFYQFAVYLNQVGLLDLPIVDGKALYSRYLQRKQMGSKFKLMNLFFMRVPLIQPDGLLNRTRRLIAPMFTKTAFALWLAALVGCLVLLTKRWTEFCDPLGSMLTTGNLPILWCLLVGLKVFHEFGHAYACKHFGGRVPEMGAFFIVLTPCAYMDASASWSFTNRIHRIIVSMGGVYFESIIAMGAFAFWCLSEPSELRALAHYAVILSTIVTVGFNANPLLRYDGYYILADLVNMPNLRQQATSQLAAISKYWMYGVPPQHVVPTRSGQFALAGYGLLANAYRTLVVLGIVTLVALKIPAVGLLVGCVFVLFFFGNSIAKLCLYLTHSEELSSRRTRAWAVTAAVGMTLFSLFAIVPTPRNARATGIVERSEDTVLRAAASGFLQTTTADDGQPIVAGDVVCQIANHELLAAVQQQKAVAGMLQSALYSAIPSDINQASALQRRHQQALQELRRLETAASGLTLTSPTSGQLADVANLREPGRYVQKGEPLARVTSGDWILRVVSPEDGYTKSQPNVGDQLTVRLAGTGRKKLQGEVVSLSKAATDVIADPRLTQVGGGSIPVGSDMRAQSTYFEMKVKLIGDIPSGLSHGMHGVAIFECPPSRVSHDLYRLALRFLNRLRVDS